jgi:tRNA (mo5U34)-methyltransferase
MASSYFGMPEDLSGKTVLDIGCSDGMFSFEAERRGATVTAMDTRGPGTQCIGKPTDWPAGFHFAKRILGSKVEFMEYNLFNLDQLVVQAGPGEWEHAEFDLTLFYGVLYHLKDPIEGLRQLAAVTKETALIETAGCIGLGPTWELRPGHHGDPTNLWYPSVAGLEAALKHVGFQEAHVVGAWPELCRFTVKATK